MTKLADADARRLIEERLDLNMLVEAGAGSGKTYCLAHRMAAGIVSGRYAVEEIAAVTFTRKAAAELRGRFQLALEERLATSAGDERSRIERALGSLEHLFAGTIHSFCAHLLRERPVEAGIAPGFSEVDEVEDASLRETAWRDYLARLRGARSPLLDELQRARVSARDLDAAFATLCTFDEVEFPPGDAPEPDIKAARKAAEAFWRQLQALMPTPVPDGAKCKLLERAQRFRGLLRAAGSGRPADLAGALACWETPPKVTMCWWAEGGDRQRTVRAEVEKLVADFCLSTVLPFVTAWRQYLYRLAVTLLAGARESARVERRRALALNYGDLLTAAAALLRGNASVRAALQRKYRWLLVDEFQDTDPIQAEVMLLLAAEAAPGGGQPSAEIDAYDVALRPGALFVVGDPKQSIFRFRRADIDIYTRVREAIVRSGGRVVPLTTSFRASPALCQWANEVFESLLPPVATPQQAAFGRLDPNPAWTPRRADAPAGPRREKGRGRGAANEPGLRTLTVPAEVAKKDVSAWDAEAIARYIRAEVDAGRAAWDDFLVLTRKKKHLGQYASALQARQIPVEVSGAGAFGGSAAVPALVKLLRALADPADATASLGVLRGPLFGVSDAQLFAHRQGGGFFGFSPVRPEQGAGEGVTGEAATRKGQKDEQSGRSEKGGPPVERALERLGSYLWLTRTLPLAAAVERILEESGLLALAAATGEGGGAAGDLLHAVDLVREVAQEGGSLAEAAAALESASESSDVEAVPLEPGRPSVVRVMNLHKAKGLEAAFVFLADPLGAAQKTASVRIVRDGRRAQGYLAVLKAVNEFRREMLAHPAGWDEHEAAELAYVLAEETRLLYVAATRARERLVVSCWDGESKGARPWAPLEPHLAEAPELAIPASKVAPPAGKSDLSAAARRRAAAARERRRELARRPTWAVARVTEGKAAEGKAAEGKAAAKTADATARGGAEPGRGAPDAQAPRRLDSGFVPVDDAAEAAHGPAWGTLVHALLEQAGRRPGTTRADLERLAAWLIVETPELRASVPAALELVERILAAPFWAEARAGGRVGVEVPFAVRVPAGESLGDTGPVDLDTVVHGVIDLVYRAGDGWRIVDYKTGLGSSPGTTLVDRHASQLSRYRAAWERATGQPVLAAEIVGVGRSFPKQVQRNTKS